VRILNYSPGTLNTEMVQNVLNGKAGSFDPSLINVIKKQAAEGFVREPEEAAGRLAAWLRLDNFTSGTHINYNDGEPE